MVYSYNKLSEWQSKIIILPPINILYGYTHIEPMSTQSLACTHEPHSDRLSAGVVIPLRSIVVPRQ